MVGDGVRGFAVGDRVIGGGFASLRNIGARHIYKLPASNLAPQHWLVEPVSCCVTGVDRRALKPGERMVMIGAGIRDPFPPRCVRFRRASST